MLLHVSKNAMSPVLTTSGLQIGYLLGGSVLIETIFSLDGLGLLGFESIINRDYPVVFATLYIFSLLGLVVNLISDLAYTWIDPRIDFFSVFVGGLTNAFQFEDVPGGFKPGDPPGTGGDRARGLHQVRRRLPRSCRFPAAQG